MLASPLFLRFPASMPREPGLLFDIPYPYITVSTLIKAIAFQVERLCLVPPARQQVPRSRTTSSQACP